MIQLEDSQDREEENVIRDKSSTRLKRWRKAIFVNMFIVYVGLYFCK